MFSWNPFGDTVARERAGEFGSIGIPATGEEEEDPSRGEEKGEKAGEIQVVFLSSFESQSKF